MEQYMQMFLEESIDNLQDLNEALLILEKTPGDMDILNKIFRIAHTIKGMAATMGYNTMASLTHKMEDVLSKFRDGNLEPSSECVTVLFSCLDLLEKIVSNIENNGEELVDISDIVEKLELISNDKNIREEVAVEQDIQVSNTDKRSILELNEYETFIVKEAKNNGFKPCNVYVQINENALLKSARAFLILQELEKQGEIIKSFPTVEEIEQEQFGNEIYYLLVTDKDVDYIKEIVMSIAEVTEALVTEVEIETKSDTDEKATTIESKEIIKDKEAPVKEKKQGKLNKKNNQSIRVDLNRVDSLMNMVSELVIYRTRFEEILKNSKSPELIETLEQVERTTSDLQELVMKIRMLPLEVVFNRFPRMIRDLSLELGKEIKFVMEGANTELDRTVIDEIGEPLIHLLRNAADHGIESEEKRIKANKNRYGTVKLLAYQEGTKALIKVIDDGAGIDVEKVRNKANKLGIKTEGLDNNQIRSLIFHQGFSTNEVVTDVSGRGVGMDVVKTKIESLGGTVEISSELGVGTTFTIKLPLTLQIIQALLVEVGGETFAISLGFVDKVVEFKEEDIKKTNGKEVIVYRDKIIPLIRLNKVLDLEEAEDKNKYMVIVKSGGKLTALLIDSLLDQQEIVIKPLGDMLKSTKEYIGATILGNGLVTLILDVSSII